MKSFKKNLIISIALFAMSLPLISFADDEIGTVLITGANRGIGLEFTKQYLEKGWTVIATARKPDKAEDLKQLQNQYPILLKELYKDLPVLQEFCQKLLVFLSSPVLKG